MQDPAAQDPGAPNDAGATANAPGTAGLPPMPPPPATPPARGLFGTVAPRNLSLGTAIEVAFRTLGKPALLLPIMVIAILINAITEVILGPSLAQLQELSSGVRPSIEDLSQLIGALGLSVVIGLIGGAVAAIYGTVWAVAASLGPIPTIGETLALVRRRWAPVLGASLLVAAIVIGLFVAGALIVVAVSRVSAALAFGVAMALLVVYFWLFARLYMTSWLAADGLGVLASLRGSWRITEGSVIRILGWTFAYGLLFALVSAAAGAVLGSIPYVGQGIAQGLTLALGYGAGVTLFRRTQASATPPAPAPTPPTVSETPIG